MTAPETPVLDDETPDEPGPNRRKALTEWGVIIAVAVLLAIIIKTFAFQAFYIPSASMDPTLKVHDRVLVNKLSYRLGDISRGDIVVFERPEGQAENPAIKDLIKRVVALPGEKVEGREGKVFINDQPLAEPYLPEGMGTLDFGATTVPEGSYWVMGDNRRSSQDSRFFGPIPEDLIVGRAFIRVWPIPSVGLL